MSQSLLKRQHELARAEKQLELLNRKDSLPHFQEKLLDSGIVEFRTHSLEVMQINVGKMCNQVCKHCHVDAGPDRKEIMTKEIMNLCLASIKASSIKTVDLTGGAPEMNPDFRWFVEELYKLDVHIIVRCNLTIIKANKKYNDLPDFFKKHKVEVVSSLPHYSSMRTNAQRGNGVFEDSIEALKLLNQVGYGLQNDLILNLVYNPTGSFLPGDQTDLEKEFKNQLLSKFGIHFNHLFAITNLPVSRFLDYLVQNEKYEDYLQSLVDAFNPDAATGVMCKNMVSVSWDGYLYDCDFNQMLEMKINGNSHISEFSQEFHENRNIKVAKHCFGCTAGSGSSCGGTVTK